MIGQWPDLGNLWRTNLEQVCRMLDETSDRSGHVHDLWLPEKNVGLSLLSYSTAKSWDSSPVKDDLSILVDVGISPCCIAAVEIPADNRVLWHRWEKSNFNICWRWLVQMWVPIASKVVHCKAESKEEHPVMDAYIPCLTYDAIPCFLCGVKQFRSKPSSYSCSSVSQ